MVNAISVSVNKSVNEFNRTTMVYAPSVLTLIIIAVQTRKNSKEFDDNFYNVP